MDNIFKLTGNEKTWFYEKIDSYTFKSLNCKYILHQI